MRKSQSWSVDIILAAIVFIFAFILFYRTIGGPREAGLEELQREAIVVAERITSENSTLTITSENEVDQEKLKEFIQSNYTEIKQKLGIAGDFCIYFKDQEGSIILFNESGGTSPGSMTISGKGSSNINISGMPCVEVVVSG